MQHEEVSKTFHTSIYYFLSCAIQSNLRPQLFHMAQIKIAATDHEVAGFISNRWSPRSFSANEISSADMNKILEAARWSPSANNEQPWKYFHAHRGTDGFQKILGCLSPGNLPWAQNAAVIVVATARKTFEANGKENPYAWHDLGMANASLMFQAYTQDIYSHFMAGLDKLKLAESLMLSPDLDVVGLIALGYLAPAENLDEPYRTRELTPRSRKPLSEISSAI
jgi:nitroreductase